MYSRYPSDLSSIPRATQAVWLKRPSTPLVLGEVFNRRKNLVMSDLHVLLVTSDKAERAHMKRDLDGLGYKTTVATSGKSAMEMLATRSGDFHVVLTSVGLTAASAGEGPDCAGLLAWARDLPSLKEVAMIVLGSYSIDAQHTIELIRCGAMDVFTKPVPVETLHRLRNLVAMTQSLQQQRYATRGEGGARLVTSYLLRKERDAPDQMGLPLNILDKTEESAAASALNDVSVSVLLMQRETRKSHELPLLLRECGYTIGGIARSKNEVLRALGAKNAQYSLLIIEMGQESVPGVGADPRHAEFFSSAQAVLREMSLRQVLLPTIAVQEEKSTDSVVRTMRLGVVDAVLPPFTKPKFRALLRYVLKASDQRFLVEESKRLHIQQSSIGAAVGGRGDKGGDGGEKSFKGGGGDGGSGSMHKRSQASMAGSGSGSHSVLGSPQSAVATAAVARIDATRSSQQHSKRLLGGLNSRLLDAREVDRQLKDAERVLFAAEEDALPLTLTAAASQKRIELQKEVDAAEKAEREAQPLDERLVASQEAIDAFQKAADAAKRNARRLASVLEREQAMGGSVGSASRDLLEQRVGAANAAAAALQNRLSSLEHAHQRKQEALMHGGSPGKASRKDAGQGKKGQAPTSDPSILQPTSLLMVPHWNDATAGRKGSMPFRGDVLAGLANVHTASEPVVRPGSSGSGQGHSTAEGGVASPQAADSLPEMTLPVVNWKPMTMPSMSPKPSSPGGPSPAHNRSRLAPSDSAQSIRPPQPGRRVASSMEPSASEPSMRRRRGALGEAEEAAARAASASDRQSKDAPRAGRPSKEAKAEMLNAPTQGGAVLRIGLTHTSDCDCTQCERRKQLLEWRDTMLKAQRHVETERRRFLASHSSARPLTVSSLRKRGSLTE